MTAPVLLKRTVRTDRDSQLSGTKMSGCPEYRAGTAKALSADRGCHQADYEIHYTAIHDRQFSSAGSKNRLMDAPDTKGASPAGRGTFSVSLRSFYHPMVQSGQRFFISSKNACFSITAIMTSMSFPYRISILSSDAAREESGQRVSDRAWISS